MNYKDYAMRLKREKKLVKATQALLIISLLLLWEIATYFNIVDKFIFSRPSQIIMYIINMSSNGELLLHTSVTGYEIIISFVISNFLGFIISVLLWNFKFMHKVFNPYLVIFNTIPKTALAPLIIILIGNNIKSIIITAIITSIVVTILNTLAAFNEVSVSKLKLLRTFKATKIQILRKLIIPASMPAIFNTIKINLGLSFVGAIIGEFLVAKSGLGYLIVYGSQTFNMNLVMSSIIVLLMLALILYYLCIIIEKRILKRL